MSLRNSALVPGHRAGWTRRRSRPAADGGRFVSGLRFAGAAEGSSATRPPLEHRDGGCGRRPRRLPQLGLLCALALALSSDGFARAEPPARGEPPARATTAAEQQLAEHGFSASRLLSLGRAQLAEGQLGPAIVSFERGLLLAPRDEALRASLKDARNAAGLEDRSSPRLVNLLQWVSLREWGYAAFGATLLLSLAVVVLAARSGWRRSGGTLLAIAGVAGTISAAGIAVTCRDLDRAYVLRDESAVRQSPFSSARATASLRAGASVSPIDHHANFVLVETERGVSGWISNDDLEPLVPEAPLGRID